MARKKKVEEVAEEIPAVEEAAEEVVVEAEAPAVEEAAEEVVVEEVVVEAEAPAVHVVTLKGSIGSQFHGSVNGVNFVYPCGIELEVPDHIYHAIKAHLV